VLTLDLQVLGQRHKDIRNGLTAPPRITLANVIDMAMKPRWSLAMLGTKRRTFGNIVGHAKDVEDLASLSAWTAQQFDPSLDWDDVRQFRKEWQGKLILKGIIEPEDAKIAADIGADAVIVSNHGGRQLDGAISSVAALGPVVDAVGDKIEVHMDGGIRSGQDVLKALALGAKGTYIGRAFLYGLGAMGEEGVLEALRIIRNELDISMALCGVRDVKNLSRDNIILPDRF
jgi:L-lactate dehydrogenase (cytochrome)